MFFFKHNFGNNSRIQGQFLKAYISYLVIHLAHQLMKEQVIIYFGKFSFYSQTCV